METIKWQTWAAGGCKVKVPCVRGLAYGLQATPTRSVMQSTAEVLYKWWAFGFTFTQVV